MRVESRESGRSSQEFVSITRAIAIVNPNAGPGLDDTRARERAAIVRDAFARAGSDVEIVFTERAGHAAELAARAASDGVALVLAWGGDGTINEAAGALVGTDTAFALVAGGSGNGLARSLGVPLDPSAALHRALTSPPRRIDAGTIGGRRFFNVAGTGFDAHIARLFNERGRGHRGGWPYVALCVREGWRYRARDYRLEIDGVSRQVRALIIAFANGREYGLGLSISPAARLDDGVLDATIVEDRPSATRFWHARHLAFGDVRRAPSVTIVPAHTAVIETDGPMAYHVDGEVHESADGRLDVAVMPGALLVRG